MIINFRYSMIEDLRILKRIYRVPKDYRSLRSVVWNPFVVIPFALNSKKNLAYIRKKWKSVRIPDDKLTKTLTCYITSVGPEGMFDVNRNAMHVRYYKLGKLGGWDGFVDSVLHESAHIEIYDSDEKKVEDFLKGIR